MKCRSKWVSDPISRVDKNNNAFDGNTNVRVSDHFKEKQIGNDTVSEISNIQPNFESVKSKND